MIWTHPSTASNVPYITQTIICSCPGCLWVTHTESAPGPQSLKYIHIHSMSCCIRPTNMHWNPPLRLEPTECNSATFSFKLSLSSNSFVILFLYCWTSENSISYCGTNSAHDRSHLAVSYWNRCRRYYHGHSTIYAYAKVPSQCWDYTRPKKAHFLPQRQENTHVCTT